MEKNQGGRKRWPKNQRGEQSEPSTSRPTEKEQEPQVYQREQQPIQQQQKPPTSVWKDKRERPPGPTQPTTQSQSSGGKFPDDKRFQQREQQQHFERVDEAQGQYRQQRDYRPDPRSQPVQPTFQQELQRDSPQHQPQEQQMGSTAQKTPPVWPKFQQQQQQRFDRGDGVQGQYRQQQSRDSGDRQQGQYRQQRDYQPDQRSQPVRPTFQQELQRDSPQHQPQEQQMGSTVQKASPVWSKFQQQHQQHFDRGDGVQGQYRQQQQRQQEHFDRVQGQSRDFGDKIQGQYRQQRDSPQHQIEQQPTGSIGQKASPVSPNVNVQEQATSQTDVQSPKRESVWGQAKAPQSERKDERVSETREAEVVKNQKQEAVEIQKPSSKKGKKKQEQPVTPKDIAGDLNKLKITKEKPIQLHKRTKPCDGKDGKPIRIKTNHVPLFLDKICSEAYHYDCTFDPDRPKRLFPAIMDSARAKLYPTHFPSFDGKRNMYSAKKLPLQNDSFSGEISINEPDRDKPTVYKITIKLVNVVNLMPLRNYMKNLENIENIENAIQCVDIVLRAASSVTLTPIGRNFFSPPKGSVVTLGEGLQLWHGLFQSATLGSQPFLNIDVVNKGVTTADSFCDVISQIASTRDPIPVADIDRNIGRYSYVFDDFLKSFRNLKISYMIPKQESTKRKCRMNGLEGIPEKQFFSMDENAKNESRISVFKFFAEFRNYTIRYKNLPTVWIGSKEKKVLVPFELCSLVPGQPIVRKYTEMQTRNMIREAATSTDVREKKIMNNFEMTNMNNQKCIREFGIHVGDKFTEVEARILEPPTVLYKQNSATPKRGAWNISEFLKACTINTWTILSLCFIKDHDIINLERMLLNKCRNFGIRMEPPKKYTAFNRPEDRNIIRYFQEHDKFDLIIVILDDRDKRNYPLIKNIAEVNVGVLTQCLKSSTVTRKLNDATVANIFLKINAKLNGINHNINKSRSKPTCLGQPCMIMGADVTHSAPDQRNEPSVAAVTASHDPEAFMYNITTRLQEPKMEIIGDLEKITIDHLKYFYKMTGQKPLSIYFFRDGVSDGQFQQVMHEELCAIKRACRTLGNGSYNPKVTFLVVQKRHHTRFFPINTNVCEDRNRNLPAGTIVDKTIVRPDSVDFFLLSHGSIQGVSKPTRYRILFDENNNSDDDIERLTFYLCHLFSRCARSVSYPAPTYYAHLAAFRAKHHLKGEPINLDNLREAQKKYDINENFHNMYPMFFV